MGETTSGLMRIIWRKGDELDPFPFIEEQIKVVGSRVFLKEIPDNVQKVRVKNLNNQYLIETKSPFPNVNEYNVDYNSGIVYFNYLDDGNTFTFSYYGRGYVLMNGDRIINENNESISKLIKEINDTLVVEGQDWMVEP